MYPTKEEILAEPRPTYPKGLMSMISDWKKSFYEGWADLPGEERFSSLQILLLAITEMYHGPHVILYKGTIDRYLPGSLPIIETSNLSILSALHELGHHLFGPDELQACRWSVWLYQLRFRKDYNNLVWDEHRLVRPSSSKAKE